MRKWEIIKGFILGLALIARMQVSEWSNKYRILSSQASARPGPYNIDATPYLQEIVDCLSETSEVSEVVFMKGAQIGATEVGNNWIGYIIHVAPAATLMVMPTDETVKRNSKVRIDPMIEASPVLSERVKTRRSRDSGNTITQKDFPGGFLIMTGANSPAALRSLPIKNVMFDEVDGYPVDVGGEGSPIELGKARTNTYMAKRKIFMLSTPTVEGISVIDQEFKNSDQRYYHVPCPKCGVLQTIEFENIVWEKGKPETAKLKCKGCDELIDEKHKKWMMARENGAQWIAMNPDHSNKRRRGFHLSALYSTLGYSWADAARQKIESKGDERKVKTFVNTVLGLPYKETVDVPEWATIYGRREHYKRNIAPIGTGFITVGTDIQKDRIELEIVAWLEGKESYSLDYRVLMGDTSADEVWNELAKVVDELFDREDGVQMPVRMMAVDTGYNTTEAYSFCKRFDINKVIPVKGRDELNVVVGIPRSVDVNVKGKAIGKTKLWGVGVSVIKSELYGWLRQVNIDNKPTPIGYCHFPEYDEFYFKMLTAEEKKIGIDKRGFKRYIWNLPSHRRNEALDCRVYARAAAAVVGLDRFNTEDWAILREQYIPVSETHNPKSNENDYDNGGGLLDNDESIW